MRADQREMASVVRTAKAVPHVGLEFSAFGPSEATPITGCDNALRGELRRSKLLAHSDGLARFDLFGLAFQQSINLLRIRGGPRLAARAAHLVAFGTAWHVLAWPDAYAGDHNKVLSWDRTTFAKIESWRAATALVRSPDLTPAAQIAEIRRLGSDSGGFNWSLQADWLRKEIFRRRQCEHEPSRFFVWWPDGRCGWTPSLDAAFNDGVSSDPNYAGAVVLLDQDALASQLVERAGRPFVHVTVAGSR